MELPWSNLLAMANAMTGTPWLFFVLYLHVSLDLTLFQMGLLMAYLYLLRWMANNTVLYLFDRLSRHYSMFLILFCTLVGLSGLLVFIVLSSYSSLLVGVMDSGCYWYIVFGVMTLFGAFYLSLGVLVESVILKSWGEYRMYFYGHHRPWSEWTVVCLTGSIGIACTLFATFGGDGDPAALLPPLFAGMIFVGVVVMCVIAIFKIQSMPSDPTCLGLTPSTPWLLKNAVLQPSDLLLLPSYFAPYKPYSLFGESLSHISEEDASMVERISSHHPSLIRQSSRCSSQSAHSCTTIPPIPITNNTANGSSHLNGAPSSYGATIYPPSTPTATDSLNYIPSWMGAPHPLTNRRLSSNTTTYSYDPLATPIPPEDDDLASQPPLPASSSWNTVPSYELALFSFVPPDMPSIATLPFIMYYLHNRGDHITTATVNPSTRYSATTPIMANTYMPGPLLINPPPLDHWKLRSLQLTVFLLGCVSAMLQVFLFVYLYDCLDLPMFVIGLTGSCIILSEIVLLTTVTKWIHGMNLTGMTTLIHATLIICAFSFLWLRPHHGIFATLAAILLPLIQSGAFYMAWLVMSDRINTLVWSDTQRIFQRAILSTFFCTLGPMAGVILTGYLISNDLDPSAFASVYHASIGLVALSFVVSWGWSADE